MEENRASVAKSKFDNRVSQEVENLCPVVDFPDMQHILEKSCTIDDVWRNYIGELRNSQNFASIACANKLGEINLMRTSRNIVFLDSEFKGIKGVCRNISKKYGIPLTISRRQKDFIGLIEKMQLLVNEGHEKNRNLTDSLEMLNDFLGIRVIVNTGAKDNEESVKICYEVMNEILKYLFIKKSHIIYKMIYSKTEKKFKDSDNIFIPESSEVIEMFEENVKDYVKYPKPNGYQSLHSVTRNQSLTGRQVVEIQVRTMAMHLRAEYGSADHDSHKQNRYGTEGTNLDFSRINISGVIVDGNQIIADAVGLRKSIDPLNLLM